MLLIVLGVVGAGTMAWADPPERSIFQQARVVAPVLPDPIQTTSPQKEAFLLRSLGLGEIQIPEAYGRIVDIYEGNSEQTLIHIQDAHVHYEAQKNLASILESLIRNNDVKLILVEGGDIRGDLSSLRKLGSKEARTEVAERYLRKGLIAGDEYLELVSDYPIIRQGIEDAELYEENFRVFLEVERLKKVALDQLDRLQEAVETLKKTIYSSAHLDLEKMREAYETEQMELVDYYEYLAAYGGAEGYPNVERLLQAYRLEKAIDFGQVDEERNRLIETLTDDLTQEELDLLVSQSLAYQEGKVSQRRYYGHVANVASEKSVALEDYPNLEKYVRYLSLYGDIQHSELFKEGDRLEQAVREKLFTSEDERQLAAISKHLRLLSGLFRLKISPDDFALYQKNRLRFSVKTFIPYLEGKINEHRLEIAIPQEVGSVDEHLKTMDRFYRIAQARDVAFVENSMREMKKEKVTFAVLITGGFHTPGLTQILREQGISHIVISPRITEAGNPELYYTILKEKSHLIVGQLRQPTAEKDGGLMQNLQDEIAAVTVRDGGVREDDEGEDYLDEVIREIGELGREEQRLLALPAADPERAKIAAVQQKIRDLIDERNDLTGQAGDGGTRLSDDLLIGRNIFLTSDLLSPNVLAQARNVDNPIVVGYDLAYFAFNPDLYVDYWRYRRQDPEFGKKGSGVISALLPYAISNQPGDALRGVDLEKISKALEILSAFAKRYTGKNVDLTLEDFGVVVPPALLSDHEATSRHIQEEAGRPLTRMFARKQVAERLAPSLPSFVAFTVESPFVSNQVGDQVGYRNLEELLSFAVGRSTFIEAKVWTVSEDAEAALRTLRETLINL